jgi:hypothetical protein
MHRFGLTICVLSVIIGISSCDKQPDDRADVFTIKSEISHGFSLREMKVLNLAENLDLIDFLVSSQISDNGEVLGAFLSHPKLESIFMLSGSFPDLNSADIFYNSLTLSDEPAFVQFALMLNPYQVWAIRSNGGQMGKILILESQAYVEHNTHKSMVKFRAARLDNNTENQN